MPLLNAHHPNIGTAALSLATNRASKIGLLLEGNHADLATKFADSLVHDACECIAENDMRPETMRNLAEIAVNARKLCG